jgi:hypothetical protein
MTLQKKDVPVLFKFFVPYAESGLCIVILQLHDVTFQHGLLFYGLGACKYVQYVNITLQY